MQQNGHLILWLSQSVQYLISQFNISGENKYASQKQTIVYSVWEERKPQLIAEMFVNDLVTFCRGLKHCL